MSVNLFLSVVLQCHVVCCLNVYGTHLWKLRSKPGWADMSKTSRIDHQLMLLSLAIGLIFPVHRVLTFLAVFQWEYPESLICTSNRVHLRQTGLRCRRVWCPSFFGFFDCCHLHWFLSQWISTSWALVFVPTISSFVSVHSAVSTLTLESRVLYCRFSATFVWVAFFSCQPSCSCRIFLCLSLFGWWHQLPSNLHLVCFRLMSSWRRVCSSSNPQSSRVMRYSFPT